MQTAQFQKKPLIVEAVQVTTENFLEVAQWASGTITNDDGSPQQHIFIKAHRPDNPRQTKAFVGDWVLRTRLGFKIYKNKAFTSNFDPIEETATVNEQPLKIEETRLLVSPADEPISEAEVWTATTEIAPAEEMPPPIEDQVR